MKISAETVRELIEYDPATGTLSWKLRNRLCFTSDRACSTWNAQNAGKPALTSGQSNGYLRGSIFKQGALAHRVAFAIAYGRWPSEIDHINGDKSDNRLENLREVTRAENMRNLPRRKKSGAVMGVSQTPNGKAWVARIGDSIRLGTFATEDAAIAARREAMAQRGYHPNHGRPSGQQEALNG